MTEELKRIYMDEDGNLQFGEQFLEEVSQEKLAITHQNEPGTLERLLGKLLEKYTGK